MGYVVVARWTVQAGAEDAVLAALRELLTPSRAESGCQAYYGTRDPEDPRTFLFFEIFDDEAAFDAHRNSEHFQRVFPTRVLPLLETRERWTYETID